MFLGTFKEYVESLRASITSLNVHQLSRHSFNLGYYIYIILDANKIDGMIDLANCSLPLLNCKQNVLIDILKDACIYVGKGKNARKFIHAIRAKKDMQNNEAISLCPNSKAIIRQWYNSSSIIIHQMPTEVTSMEAHCREYAIIKAIGLSNLSNRINGTSYGIMRDSWNDFEVTNFGTMLLYNAMHDLLSDLPFKISEHEI